MISKIGGDIFYQVDIKTADEFNSRYSKGYMTTPRVVEKKRISEVLKNIDLPKIGIALDFGCGKGDFTILLHQLLPNWRIIGLDISEVAIKKAKELHPELEFNLFDEFQNTDLKFDFIFSHHVLEYVPDIEYVFSKFENLSKENSIMLHIVPCGNHEGLEYRIASMVNGVNSKNGLYFFEHSAHVKRYSDKELVAAFEKFSFKHKYSWFVDQYWGALEWITRSNWAFLNFITPLRVAVSNRSVFRLTLIKMLLYFFFILRYPYFNYERTKGKMNWSLSRKILFFSIVCLYAPSMFFNRILLLIVDFEWWLLQKNRGGGKMYLLFIKNR
jgi:trans-aconitate methyltransferase